MERRQPQETAAAQSITEPKRNPFKYAESKGIRSRATPEGRALWKLLWKRKKQHKEAWRRELLQEVLKKQLACPPSCESHQEAEALGGSADGGRRMAETHEATL